MLRSLSTPSAAPAIPAVIMPATPAASPINRDAVFPDIVSSSARILAVVVAQPERLESVTPAVELAPGVAFDVTRLAVAGEGVDRPVAVGPHMQRVGLPWRGAMARL